MTELSIRIALLLSLALTAPLVTAATDEQALLQKLQQAEQQAPSPALRVWLGELVRYQEVARKPHPDRATQDLPRHQLAARASALLRRWDEQAAFEQLQSQPQQQLKSLSSDVAQAARIRWIGQANASQLRRYQASHSLQSLPENILLALAQALPEDQQDQELARRGQLAQSLNYLRQQLLNPKGERSQQRRLLQQLRDNPALRGAVPALHTGWLAQHPAQRQAFVQQWQNNWSADTVASVLQLQPAGLTEQLSNILKNQPDKAALAAWALWQQATPAAQQALADYAQSSQAIEHLAQEIRAWQQ